MDRTLSARHVRGFTLVELSVVVVVIGFVIGAIYAGTNIIGGAKTRAVKNEIAGIDKAIGQFKDQFGGMPGDLPDAEARFGCTGCNGNGDGFVDATEAAHFWQHLSVSNMIKGNYDPASTELGVGYPKSSAFDNSGYKLETRTGNRMVLVLAGGGGGYGAVSPQLADQLDRELDDGKPLSGNMIVEVAAGAAATACNSGNAYVATGEDSVCNIALLLSKDGLFKEDGEKQFYQYRWQVGDWGSCSAVVNWETGSWGECQVNVSQGGEARVCGTGYQERSVVCPISVGTQSRGVTCVDISGAAVASGNCSGTMPATVKDCNGECSVPAPAATQECDLGSCEENDWVASAWSECNAPSAWVIGAWGSCSGGVKTRTVDCDLSIAGTQTRTVYCPSEPSQACSGAAPSDNQPCTATACPQPQPAASQLCDTAWSVGDWSACSANWTTSAWGSCTTSAPSCTTGVQTRTVTCDISPATQTRTVTCPSDPEPCVGAEPASTQPCDQTCDVAATPANSQNCNVPSDLQVLNSISVLQRHTITADSYVACLIPTTCSTQSLDCGNSQNCSFTAAADTETVTASCPSGYTGSPQRTCTAGTWGALSGGCSAACSKQVYASAGTNSYVVPTGVTSVKAKLWGGAGGSGAVYGGGGGFTNVTIPVTPGETLTVIVGGGGGPGGGRGAAGLPGYGPGGGGGTGIKRGATILAVAGGGGGAGFYPANAYGPYQHGGAGGGLTGGSSPYYWVMAGTNGGTQSAPGAPAGGSGGHCNGGAGSGNNGGHGAVSGYCTPYYTAGGTGLGNGGTGSTINGDPGAGGGGGGYYGGGGGNTTCGGGGGSGYVSASITGTTTTAPDGAGQPAGTTDPDYASPAGKAGYTTPNPGMGGPGNAGRAVIDPVCVVD